MSLAPASAGNTDQLAPAYVAEPARYLPELDTLRALAITLVFVYHADILFAAGHSTPLPAVLTFIRAGHTGVSLFFVLSAFLLAQPFLAEAEGGPRVARGRYYARRALRILPLYWLAVVAAVVLSPDPGANLRAGLAYLVFLNFLPAIAEPILPWSVVWWSLAIEVQFYLVLPLLASRAGRLVGGVGLAVYAVAYAGFLLRVFPFGATEYQRFSSATARCSVGHRCFSRASRRPPSIAAMAMRSALVWPRPVDRT